MLILSTPVTQERLNAAVKEVVGLTILGPVLISSASETSYYWDPCALIDYLENALRIAVIPTLEEDGSRFLVWGKCVEFTEQGVLISPGPSWRGGGCRGYRRTPAWVNEDEFDLDAMMSTT